MAYDIRKSNYPNLYTICKMSFIRNYIFPFLFVFLLMFSCSVDLQPELESEPGTGVTDTIPGEDDPEEDTGNDDEEDNGEEETEEDPEEEILMYFPPAGQESWETLEADSLGWDTSPVAGLYEFLERHNTRGFMVLYRGHIVLEHYYGLDYDNNAAFTANTMWYWASAGKTLTAFLVGVAQEEGYLNIDDPVSDYLGEAWSSVPPEKEELITVKSLLTMTSGLDYTVDDYCTDKECLQYRDDAGAQWHYHNAPYNLLDDILENATGAAYEDYSENVLEDPVGMSGEWRYFDEYNNIYWSSARDAARYGLLMLNNAVWDNTTLMNDAEYFNAMLSTSQDINPAYGYLWWLNGKGEIILPGSGGEASDFFSPYAPENMYVAAGLNGQFIDIIPELELVVVRLGDEPKKPMEPREMHDEMWKFLKDILEY